MRIASVRAFRDRATEMLRSEEPIIVMRRGEVAGIFFPQPGKTIPLDARRELFQMLTDEIGNRLRQRGVSEEEVISDFEQWRKKRRSSRRRR